MFYKNFFISSNMTTIEFLKIFETKRHTRYVLKTALSAYLVLKMTKTITFKQPVTLT